MDTLQWIWDAIRPHLGTIALVLTWLGIGLAYYRKRVHWRAKRFTDQVNFSLNYVDNGALQLRTLLETSTAEVWLNQYGVNIVLAAASKTRSDQPFIVLDDPADMAFVKRAVLNVLSEKFAAAFLATSLKIPVKESPYYFATTFENFPDMRTRKFRVLLVEAQSLADMFGPAASEPALLEPIHRDRLQVLKTMAKLAADPKTDERKVLGKVHLGVQL